MEGPENWEEGNYCRIRRRKNNLSFTGPGRNKYNDPSTWH